jgi:myo-inositol 2-dehydrogenase/D-chiro-inositol 1-dehydrogenase
MGAMHASNIAAHPDAVLHGVMDVSGAVARELARRHDARAFTDAGDALDDPDVDAVVIASSTDTHADLIEAAAARRRPIFCEKPVDLDLARVDACLVRVAEAGVPLQIGFNRRFDPHFKALHDRLRGGEIGRLEVVALTSRDPAPPPLAYVRVSGGLFRDMMIHDFDTARWLLGDEPVSLHATASCLVDPEIAQAGDVDTAVVTMKTASGVLCTISNSRRAVYGYDQRIEVLGSEGMLQAENPLPTTVRRWTSREATADRVTGLALERYRAAYRAELDAFLMALRDATPPPVGATDGRAALVLAEAALESLRSGRTVEVAR